jgi:pyrroloquinoline quinone (PQQ) biosynthesis protein C
MRTRETTSVSLDHRFAPGEKLSTAEAVALLDALYARTAETFQAHIVAGPFMRDLCAGTLPMDTVRLFWQNWYYFVSEINNFHGITYQRFLGFFKRNPSLLAAYADKIADELIHPRAPGHIAVVVDQGKAFGLAEADMLECEMLAECRAWSEWFRGLAYEGSIAEWWAAHQVEQCIGEWAGLCRRAFREQYGLTDAQLAYFQVHEEADLEVHEGGIIPHAEFNRRTLQRLLETGEAHMRPGFSIGYCARMTMDYYRLFLDACYAYGRTGAFNLAER